MKKQYWFRILSANLLLTLALFAFLSVFSPVVAAPLPAQPAGPHLQATPGGPDVQVTEVVPNTGGNADNSGGFVSSWLVWVILGIVIIVLLAALLSRTSGGPYPPQ